MPAKTPIQAHRSHPPGTRAKARQRRPWLVYLANGDLTHVRNLSRPQHQSTSDWLVVNRPATLNAVYHGALIVCLVPARVDAEWWHRCGANAAETRLPVGRLNFGDAVKGAPSPVAIVIFRLGL